MKDCKCDEVDPNDFDPMCDACAEALHNEEAYGDQGDPLFRANLGFVVN